MFKKLLTTIALTLIPALGVLAGAILSDAPVIEASTHIPLGVFITGISVTAGLAYAATKAWDSLMTRIISLEITMKKLYCVKNAECVQNKEDKNEK